MAIPIPNALETARREADAIHANREALLNYPLQRVLIDAPYLDPEVLLKGLVAYHHEAMSKIPSPTAFPEAKPWIAYVLAVDKELKALVELSDLELATLRSLHNYLAFRGLGIAAPAQDEKCRVAYVPESDHGRIHIKNLDDPATHWKPEGPMRDLFADKTRTLFSDGVGSGLHLDDEPAELFPLPIRAMFPQYAHDVPSAVEFLTRYSSFWARGNMLLHDNRKRSAAIEKCSYNFIEVFYPGADGRSHISGMTCRNPDSPQGRYQRAQREKYLRLYKQPLDGPDMAFWNGAWKFEAKLAAGLDALAARPKLDDLIRLFTTGWPEGLRKDGLRLHPKQGLIGYTLMTYAALPDEGRILRWQRSANPELLWPDQPEEYRRPAAV
jgi:hypothetical protein